MTYIDCRLSMLHYTTYITIFWGLYHDGHVEAIHILHIQIAIAITLNTGLPPLLGMYWSCPNLVLSDDTQRHCTHDHYTCISEHITHWTSCDDLPVAHEEGEVGLYRDAGQDDSAVCIAVSEHLGHQHMGARQVLGGATTLPQAAMGHLHASHHTVQQWTAAHM